MTERLHGFVKKHKDIILYLLFGILTTVVNYLVYLPLYNLSNIPAAVCNAIAWVASVIFAFFTNKPFVFHCNDWSGKTVVSELIKFCGCRIFTGLVETGVLWVAVDLLNKDGNFWKIVVSIFVILVNYLGSKFLVFKEE